MLFHGSSPVIKLFPESLVAIKTYSASSPEGGMGDQERLHKADITSYVGWNGRFQRHELKVLEADVPAAVKLLGITEHSLETAQTDGEIRCPQCRGPHVEALP